MRRAELDPSTKYVAGWLATWASADGGDLIVGERVLADALGRGERMVREHVAKLRELGLIECLLEAAPGRNAEYQLTFPGEGYALIPMRLDTDGARLSERPAGRMGQRRPVKNTGTRAPVSDSEDRHPGAASPAPGRTETGTREPVNGSVQRHPGAADAEMTGTRAHDDRHPGAVTPAPGRTFTGTRVPPTNTGPEHHHPSPRLPESDYTPTSAQPGPEPGTNATQQADPEAAYRAARRILDAAPKDACDAAVAQASRELADLGIVGVRDRLIRAARILEHWRARDLTPAEEGS